MKIGGALPSFYIPRWLSVKEKLSSDRLRFMRISLMKLLYLFRRINKIFGWFPCVLINVVAAQVHKIFQFIPSSP